MKAAVFTCVAMAVCGLHGGKLNSVIHSVTIPTHCGFYSNLLKYTMRTEVFDCTVVGFFVVFLMRSFFCPSTSRAAGVDVLLRFLNFVILTMHYYKSFFFNVLSFSFLFFSLS